MYLASARGILQPRLHYYIVPTPPFITLLAFLHSHHPKRPSSLALGPARPALPLLLPCPRAATSFSHMREHPLSCHGFAPLPREGKLTHAVQCATFRALEFPNPPNQDAIPRPLPQIKAGIISNSSSSPVLLQNHDAAPLTSSSPATKYTARVMPSRSDAHGCSPHPLQCSIPSVFYVLVELRQQRIVCTTPTTYDPTECTRIAATNSTAIVRALDTRAGEQRHHGEKHNDCLLLHTQHRAGSVSTTNRAHPKPPRPSSSIGRSTVASTRTQRRIQAADAAPAANQGTPQSGDTISTSVRKRQLRASRLARPI